MKNIVKSKTQHNIDEFWLFSRSLLLDGVHDSTSIRDKSIQALGGSIIQQSLPGGLEFGTPSTRPALPVWDPCSDWKDLGTLNHTEQHPVICF